MISMIREHTPNWLVPIIVLLYASFIATAFMLGWQNTSINAIALLLFIYIVGLAE